jgi:penicillin-binding protein 2
MNLKVIGEWLRTIFLIAVTLVLMGMCAIKLMEIQVVNGGQYLLKEDVIYKTNQTLSATRGQILDADGKPIVENTIGFDVIVGKAYFPKDDVEGNGVISGIIDMLESSGVVWNDALPISFEEPYSFNNDEASVEILKKKININTYATAENCVDKLIDQYDISGEYTPLKRRQIAGVRYAMLLSDFSMKNNYLLADNIPEELVLKIKDNRMLLPGVDIQESPIRKYAQTDVIPHELGVVAKIYAEDYELLKEKGYALNDVVGKGGLEEGLENYLKGEKGEAEITVVNGKVTQTEVITPPVAGDTVKLTIKPSFQKDVQNIMSDFFVYLSDRDRKYSNVKSGGIVVLDVKTGAVLSLATLPTYDIMDYTADYSGFMESIADTGLDTPLINRATDGLYRPGSTFKPITATAGLNEGIVTRNTTFYCGHVYNYLGTSMKCTGYHANIAVELAITKSCNIYFYELARRLGVDTLSKYETYYGFGQSLGLESGDSAGWIANPETFASKGWVWNSGLLLQAGIGQSEVAATPLQMATVASTIANRGTRLKPHIVDTIYDYTMENVILQKGREVAEVLPINDDKYYDYIIKGMVGAAQNTPAGEYSLNNLGYTVAIKTGTPQSNHPNGTSSAFIGFAPVEDPQIAFAGIIEGGEYSKYMVRKILDAYQENYGSFVIPTE